MTQIRENSPRPSDGQLDTLYEIIDSDATHLSSVVNFAIVLIGVSSLHMPGVWLGDTAFYWSRDRYTSAAVQSALPSVIHRILPDLVTGAFDNSFFYNTIVYRMTICQGAHSLLVIYLNKLIHK